jgi:hypothetical protein
MKILKVHFFGAYVMHIVIDPNILSTVLTACILLGM